MYLRRVLRSPLISLSLIGLGGCGSDDPSLAQLVTSQATPIVGGTPALPSDYPSTVALVDKVGDPFCTGTMVTTKTVVTAAHCLDLRPAGEIWVIYGSAHPAAEPPSARLPIAKAVAHPQYDPKAITDGDGLGHTNDIAVIVLSVPLAGAKITPILPAEALDHVLYPKMDIHISGYGIYNMPYEGGDLYKAITPLVRRGPWELLAGGVGKPDTCQGDSGGPAYVLRGCQLWLVGVTSRAWLKSTAACGEGGIYTIATNYREFIEQASGEALPIGSGGLPVGFCEDAGAEAQNDVGSEVSSEDAPTPDSNGDGAIDQEHVEGVEVRPDGPSADAQREGRSVGEAYGGGCGCAIDRAAARGWLVMLLVALGWGTRVGRRKVTSPLP